MKEGKAFHISQKEVLNAYKAVKANKGAGGIDGIELEEFDKDWKNRLYVLWNRMSSGSYYSKPVRGVEIPKKNGKKRLLGIPTIEDRVAQMVLRNRLEPIFLDDSYGYRPNKSAFRINGEDTMTMLNIDDLKGHGGSAVDGILSSTGWTKSAMAAKRNKFKSSTFAATIHCATKRRVTAVDHALDIFNNRLSRAQCINHFFVIISKDVLKYIAHKIIMEDKEQENNPYPSRLRGRGVEVSKTLFYALLCTY